MLLDELQKLTEQVVLPDWEKLQESIRQHASLGNSNFTFYNKNYEVSYQVVDQNVYAEPIFTALIEKCKSEGLEPTSKIFNNPITGVTATTISW